MSGEVRTTKKLHRRKRTITRTWTEKRLSNNLQVSKKSEEI